MYKDSYGFIESASGRFLRVRLNDEPFDGQESHESAWFTMDADDAIWETNDAGVVLDLLNPWGPLPFLSADGLGRLPSKQARRRQPVCRSAAVRSRVLPEDDAGGRRGRRRNPAFHGSLRGVLQRPARPRIRRPPADLALAVTAWLTRRIRSFLTGLGKCLLNGGQSFPIIGEATREPDR